ncbi:MAG: alpha/beta hydrolase [Bdellovibrio sp.]|nr:alpha/beta hydrolase [Bdellovibrio sp.]
MSKQWVLVRGIMSESYHWWDFLPQLQAHFPDDVIHTADIIGNGRNFQMTTPTDIQGNLQGLRSQVPADGKKILVGFSLGGMLSLEWAHYHPEEVEAVILINCSLNNSPFYKRIKPSSVAKILKSSLTKDLHQREQMILRMTTTGLSAESISEIAHKWGARGKEYPVQAMNFLWQIFVAAKIPQRAAPPKPVLILNSEKDQVVHPDCSAKIAKTWGLPLVRHPEAGHDLTLDDPQWVLNQINTFLMSL